MESPWNLPISELAALYRRGEATPLQVVEALQNRIADVDATLNCFVASNQDVLEDAAQSTARWQTGQPLSDLDGIPIAIKDNLAVAGMPATWGSQSFAGRICGADELPIARLRAAGALFLGKTNTPEFAVDGYTHNTLFGTTRNALNPQLTPGGSSGGSASAVAAGMAMAAIGTDGGGSIRRPAGYTGLYGFKPGIGSVPRHGGLPQVLLDFEVVGPLARCMSDLRLLYTVMAGPDTRDPASRHYPVGAVSGRALRILHVPLLRGHPCDKEILAASTRAADTLANLGHAVETGAMPIDLSALNELWPRIGRSGLARMFAAQPELLETASAPYREMAEAGSRLTASELLEVLDLVQSLRKDIGPLFEHWDIVMMPCAAARPWPAAVPYPDTINGQSVGPRGHAIYTGWINAAGIPALAIPVGPPVEGIPVGIQLAADVGREAMLLALGEQFEKTA